MPGWIALHRDVQDHWIYEEKRMFSQFEAWTSILLRVNHTEGKVMHNGTLEPVERGSTIWSLGDMEKRWGWSNTKVKRFLNRLKDDEMVTYKSTTKKTYLTVINYGKYQYEGEEKTPPKHHENTTETPPKHTNNNVNNDNKKNKKEYTAEFSEFWNVYPRKIEKYLAFTKWNTALKTNSFDYLIQCATNYANECKVKQTEVSYIKHPSTFLEKERYKDYYEKNNVVPFQATKQTIPNYFVPDEDDEVYKMIKALNSNV